MTARLFDADGHDQDIDLDAASLDDLGDRQLLWVDIDRAHAGALDVLDALDRLLPTDARDRARLERDEGRARLRATQDRLHLTLETLEDGPAGDRGRAAGGDRSALERREIDLLVGPGVVVSVHDGPSAAIARFDQGFEGDTRLGELTAAELLSSIVDEVISGYFLLVEDIERDIDRLDQRALRGRPGDDPGEDLLAELVGVRRRVGVLRRTLAPHRAALSALARPEMQTEDLVGRPWPGLVDRVSGAMDAVEGLRDALLGTYDIHMGRTAQRANDVMRILTLLSAVLLPAVVLAGVMGMNFAVPFFDDDGNFFVVLGAMAVLAGAILLVARWRRWL